MNLRAEDELQYRHRGELDMVEDNSDEEETDNQEPIPIPVVESPKKNKISKAAKKREKERQKVKEREERIAAEKAGAGPTPRDIELAIISEKIKTGKDECSNGPPFPPMRVYDILSDGHCLYRSISHQLQLRGEDSKV